MPLALVQGPSFVVVEQAAGVAAAACAPEAIANAALVDFAERLSLATNTDPQLTVVLLSAPVGCDQLFYVPVANDVRGIGYQHQDPREVFDDSPHSRLEGIAFLNDFPYWRRNAADFARAFNHELGHRWAARVHVAATDLSETALLGRQQLHWSYFLDSGGSPMEGNRWSSLDSRHFVTDASSTSFSPLDLYLMGVLEAARVPPLALLDARAEGLTDCRGASLSAESPPQLCAPLELTGRARAVTLDEIRAAEGERSPAAQDVPRQVDVSIVVVDSSQEPFSRSDCEALSESIDARLLGFSDATGGRLTLRNLTVSARTCDAWPLAEAAEALQPVGGCSVTQTGDAKLTPGTNLGWLATLWLLLQRRRRAEPHPNRASGSILARCPSSTRESG
jgi:hypothetical protein